MKFIFTLLLTAIILTATSQPTFVTQIQAPGNGYALFNKCIQQPDGSFTAAGVCSNHANNGNALLIVKMDGVGRVVTSKAIEMTGQSLALFYLYKTIDSGFAMVGLINGGNYFFAKYKPDMTLDWEKQLDINAQDSLAIYTMIQKKDGSYLLGANVTSKIQQTRSALLISMSATGDVTTGKTFLPRGTQSNVETYIISGIAETSDGNEALLISTTDSYSAKDSCLLMKITPDGNLLWAKNLHTSELGTVGNSLLSSTDKGIVVAGFSLANVELGGYSYLIQQPMMAKFTEEGTQEWSKQVVSPNFLGSSFNTVIEDKKGNYVFGGRGLAADTIQLVLNYFNYYVSLHQDGSLQWTRKKGANNTIYSNQQLPSSLISTNAAGFAASGYETLSGTNSEVASLYTFDSSFQSCNGEAADSIGSLIDSGFAENITTLASDVIPITTSNVTTSDADFGSFLYPCNSILPIKLLSFTAHPSGSVVNVNWTTENEINADSYSVEKSSDGNDFTALQKVVAKGKSSGTFSYSSTDVNPLPGTSYYRLKQTDKNGTNTYSSIVEVNCSGNRKLEVYPNPVQNTIHIILQSSTSGKILLQVMDATGKTVLLRSHTVAVGMNTIDLPVASLSKGVYFVKTVQNSTVQTICVVKK